MENKRVRRLHEGDHVVAVENGGTQISGRVEETAPHMDAAWIREDGFGARHLITTKDLLDDPATPTD